jgi:dyslexia susceptibility 1 candidate gene 1 protein
MPPLTGDYTWSETATIVKLTIPLHNSAASNVDVVCSSLFVKVSFEGYLVQIDLFGKVDDTVKGSKAVVKSGVLTLKIVKAEKGVWGMLEVDGKETGALTKDELRERREVSLEERRVKLAALHEKAKDQRLLEERGQVKKQMALEQAERQAIDDLKAAEKTKAEAAVYEKFDELRVEELKKQQASEKLEVPRAKKTVTFPPPAPVASEGDIWSSAEVDKAVDSAGNPADGFDIDRDALDEDDIDEEDDEPDQPEVEDSEDYDAIVDDVGLEDSALPAPRESTRATFKYTPRLFKTPARESTIPTEKEFVAKNRPHLRNHGLLNKEALDVSESDPVWLKGKGDDFFRSGDFLSAINAYSSAYEASSTMLPALSNRAACYLKIGEPARCIADCDDAIAASSKNQSLLDDVPGGVSGFWLKLFVRRGTARCQLGEFKVAAEDYKKAWDLNKASVELRDDYEKMAKLAEISEVKKAADMAFSSGDVEKAIKLYGEAIDADARFVSAVSNRAGALLATGQYEECISDCDAALDMLANLGSTSGPVPPPGSDKRRDWVIATVCRRSKARSELGNYADAVKDLETALKLVPEGRTKTRDDLVSDIEKMKKLLPAA